MSPLIVIVLLCSTPSVVSTIFYLERACDIPRCDFINPGLYVAGNISGVETLYFNNFHSSHLNVTNLPHLKKLYVSTADPFLVDFCQIIIGKCYDILVSFNRLEKNCSTPCKDRTDEPNPTSVMTATLSHTQTPSKPTQTIFSTNTTFTLKPNPTSTTTPMQTPSKPTQTPSKPTHAFFSTNTTLSITSHTLSSILSSTHASSTLQDTNHSTHFYNTTALAVTSKGVPVRNIVIGLTITLGAILFLGIFVGLYIYRKRQNLNISTTTTTPLNILDPSTTDPDPTSLDPSTPSSKSTEEVEDLDLYIQPHRYQTRHQKKKLQQSLV